MIRRLAFIVAALWLLASAAAFAQAPPPGSGASGYAMKKLDFLAGRWKGTGWIMTPKSRDEFNQTEIVQKKLNGTIVTIDGDGRSKADGHSVHEAFGVVYFDPPSSQFKFATFLADGHSMLTNFKVTENGFTWGFTASFGQIRYTMALTPKDEWYEIGERSTDGTSWAKVFEMTLTREK